MAEVNILHYRPGTTPLHRLDPRIKVLLLVVYVAVLLSRPGLSLLPVPVLLLWASCSAGIKWRDYRRELKVFALLGGIIFFSRAIAAPEKSLGPLLLQAGLPTAYFLLAVWLGILFTALTDPDELYSVIQWLLRPLPGVPEGRIAAQAGMTLILIPLLLDTVHEIREARKARGIELRRNPQVRMISLVNPLMETLLIHLEEFSMALEARCFDVDVVRKRLRFDRSQVLPVLVCLTPALLILFFPGEIL